MACRLVGARQAIIWTNAGILLIRPLEINFRWNLKQNLHIFIHENAYEIVVRTLVDILSRPQCFE